MGFSKFKIKVDGQDVIVDLQSQLGIVDVSKDMDKVAAKMSYWASVWSAAAEEQIRVDGQYRAWRAKAGEVALQREPKLAEWKVKQAIEGDATFLKFKDAQGKAARNVILTKGVFESFKVKGSQLQSKGAMQRSELDATGMNTRRQRPNRVEDSEAQSAMRRANAKNRDRA